MDPDFLRHALDDADAPAPLKARRHPRLRHVRAVVFACIGILLLVVYARFALAALSRHLH